MRSPARAPGDTRQPRRDVGLYPAEPAVSSRGGSLGAPDAPVTAGEPALHERPPGRPGASRRAVVEAAAVVGSATLLSRVLGFARDMVVARAFGAGPVTDAFFVAFRIPNLLRRLLAEGALSTAIIPVFTESLHRGGRAEFIRIVRATTGVAMVVLCVVSGLGMLLAPWIVRVMAPGWTADPPLVELAGSLTRFMFPYLLLVGLAALAMGALNAQHRFFTAALGPAVLHIAMIASVLVLPSRLTTPVL